MFPKTQRISRSDFLKKPIRSTSFAFGSIKILRGDTAAAVVTSKKTYATAVARGKVRRRIYAVLASIHRTNGLKGQVIIYPNKKALAAPFAELKTSLEQVLKI